MEDLLSVVAGEIIVGHGQTVFIIFWETFSSSKQLQRLLKLVFSEQIDCQHVAYVANLNAYVCKLL